MTSCALPRLSVPQRRVLRALAASPTPLPKLGHPAATVRALEGAGYVRVEYCASETRCPRSGVMVHTALPTLLHLTDEGRQAEIADRLGVAL